MSRTARSSGGDGPAMKWVVKGDDEAPEKAEKAEKPVKEASSKEDGPKEEKKGKGKGWAVKEEKEGKGKDQGRGKGGRSAAKAESETWTDDDWWWAGGWGSHDQDWSWGEDGEWAKTSKPGRNGERKGAPAKDDGKGEGKGKGKGDSAKGSTKGKGKEDGGKSKGKGKSEGKGDGKAAREWPAREERPSERKEAVAGAGFGNTGEASRDRGDRDERPRGDQGKSGFDRSAGKGKAAGKGKKGDRDEYRKDTRDEPRSADPRVGGVKTVAEIEAEMKDDGKPRIEKKVRGPEHMGKQPVEAKGDHCEVHKHSGMGCAVVSMDTAAAREALFRYAEIRFGTSAPDNRVKMDIGDVTVQLKRHTDKSTKREVVTDVFVAWGHQQEKDSPLTVDEIAEAFDKLYSEALAAGPGVNQALPAQTAAAAAAAQLTAALAAGQNPMLGMGGRPMVPPPPTHLPQMGQQMPNMAMAGQTAPGSAAAYYDYAQRAAMYNMYMQNPQAMQMYQQQMMAQQQAAQAYVQQQQQMMLQQQQLQRQLQEQHQPQPRKGGKGKGGEKGEKGDKGKGAAASSAPAAGPVAAGGQGAAAQVAAAVPSAAAPAAEAPEAPATPTKAADGDDKEEVVRDYAPAKPRLLAIVDPVSGKPIDTIGMNFAPRKPSSPLKIINPSSGQAVELEEKEKEAES
mmetsp:Transcript_6309/g.11824  ORF Transcript_6309/g.11824 Transcript_6309/m.11824 type:complete len:678 (+) Transcript_6309:71-2104(+)